MPHVACELHAWRRQRVVLGKLELRGEDAAFERGAFRALDERFPDENVVFGYGTRGDAIRRVVRERTIFLKEALRGDARGHDEVGK